MAREYRVILEADHEAGGYVVWVPALPGCASEGDSIEEALGNIREAIQCYVESALKHGEAVPNESDLTEATVRVPA